MFSIGNRRVSLLICSAIFLHLFWAAMIALDRAALNANAINALYRYIQSPIVLAGLLVTSSVLAGVALVIRSAWSPLLLIPQQIVLMASASGSIDSIWIGQFADGVIRSSVFIAADQIYAVILAVGHTFAIIMHAAQVQE